jgi:hypothetical protein
MGFGEWSWPLRLGRRSGHFGETIRSLWGDDPVTLGRLAATFGGRCREQAVWVTGLTGLGYGIDRFGLRD